jgi:terminase small subunit-like protein
MAGMPLRRARAAVATAMEERDRLVADGQMTPEYRDKANKADEDMLRQMTVGKHLDAAALPDKGAALLPATRQPGLLANVVPVYPKSPTEVWLIDKPEEIAAAYATRAEDGTKRTDATVERLLYLVRCGVPIKDSREGPGAARQCGLHPATVWDWVHSDPEFAKQFREARDASSEVLEDEMRAMLPTAMKHPEMVRSLEFVAGRLEWLARVRNKDRYGEAKQQGTGNQVTFNIGTLPAPAAAEKLIEGERVGNVIDAEILPPASVSVPLPAQRLSGQAKDGEPVKG